MEKMYIEMNDSERLLKRIHNDADWAFSMLVEGIPHMMDDAVDGTTVEEIIYWQKKATEALIEFDGCIETLIKILRATAVTGERKKMIDNRKYVRNPYEPRYHLKEE